MFANQNVSPCFEQRKLSARNACALTGRKRTTLFSLVIGCAAFALFFIAPGISQAQIKLPWQLGPAPRPANNVAKTTPHPAVARIIVPEHEERSLITGAERQNVSFGSGTLIDVRGDYGLVITNWHVVRDAAGEIVVQFPDGFRSPATIIKTDKDWDLAALSIRRPANITPVPIATNTVQPGEPLAIAGYGPGDYRMAVGKMTQYLSPGERFPFEMIELDVEARHGDSGGPILNQRGEIAGVLFGAGRGFTSGTYSGRVSGFLLGVIPEQADSPTSGMQTQALAAQPMGTAPAVPNGWAPRSPSNAVARSPIPSVPAVPFNDPAKDRVAAVGQNAGTKPLAVETLALHPLVTSPKSSPYDVTKPVEPTVKSSLATSDTGLAAPPTIADSAAGKLQTVVAKPLEGDSLSNDGGVVTAPAKSKSNSDTALLYPLGENAGQEASSPSVEEQAPAELPTSSKGAVPVVSARNEAPARLASSNLGRPKTLPSPAEIAEGNTPAGADLGTEEPGSSSSLSPRGGLSLEKGRSGEEVSTNEVMAAVWRKVGGETAFDQGKTILAIVGIFTILMKWYRWNYTSETTSDDD